MRMPRRFALVFLAILMLASMAAATASATEPGWLPLEALKEPLKVTTTSVANLFKTAAGSFKCTGVTTLKVEFGKKGDTHVLLANDVELHFTGCKQGELSCRSEGLKGEKDPSETILVLADIHLVNLLNGTELEPGVAILILDMPEKIVGTLKQLCGVAIIELKGAVKGLILGSLTEDVTKGEMHFSHTVFDKCDSFDKLCVEWEEKFPFLGKFSKVFETETTEALIPYTLSQMVLIDD